MLIHLPREEGYRHKHTVKNGPALAGYGAITMKNALTETITTLPEQLRRSLTWDQADDGADLDVVEPVAESPPELGCRYGAGLVAAVDGDLSWSR